MATLDELDKKNYDAYIQEWKSAGERIVPSSCDPMGLDFEAWRSRERAVAKGQDLPPGRVQADTYFLMEDNGYLHGAINLRYALSDSLRAYGGQIGYGVRPSSRGNRYSFIMLKQALNICRVRGMRTVLLTVHRDNKASRSVIRRAGGMLLRSNVRQGHVVEHYEIKL